jgi:hypothetical protein
MLRCDSCLAVVLESDAVAFMRVVRSHDCIPMHVLAASDNACPERGGERVHAAKEAKMKIT